jgi:hypothetical protein
MYLGATPSQKEEPRYRWVGVSGAYYDDLLLCWVSADDARYINVSGTFIDTRLSMRLDASHPSGTVSGIPILLGSSDPDPIPEPERSSKPFFVEFTRCKPPFELREDGVYLGKSKIIDRVLPVK